MSVSDNSNNNKGKSCCAGSCPSSSAVPAVNNILSDTSSVRVAVHDAYGSIAREDNKECISVSDTESEPSHLIIHHSQADEKKIRNDFQLSIANDTTSASTKQGNTEANDKHFSHPHRNDKNNTSEHPLGWFGRYLTLWILLSIIIGTVIGANAPSVASGINSVSIESINLPLSILLWLMILPMTLRINFQSMREFRRYWTILIQVFIINWGIQPFLQWGLAELFFRLIYKNIMDSERQQGYIAGAVLLGGSPCTAMVFVWSALLHGDPLYTLLQVVINDIAILFLYVPTLAITLTLSDISFPYKLIAISVVIFVVIPFAIGGAIRFGIQYSIKNRFENKKQMKKFETLQTGGMEMRSIQLSTTIPSHNEKTTDVQCGETSTIDNNNHYDVNSETARIVDKIDSYASPITNIALILTVILTFILQGESIVTEWVDIILISIPLTLQTIFSYFIALAITYFFRLPFQYSAPASLIAASNFFELALALAVAGYGANSHAARATIVGVLTEVPTMLALVWLCKKWKPYIDKRAQSR